MPAHLTDNVSANSSTASDDSVKTVRGPGASSRSEDAIARKQPEMPSTGNYQPPVLFSILVICPLVHTREAITKHIELTLPKMSPSHITERDSFEHSKELLSGDNAMRFSHLVINLPVMSEVVVLLDYLLESRVLTKTCAIIITDVKQRREINELAKHLDFEQLAKQRQVLFIFKPLKPSKMTVIFDPQKTSEISSDRNQNTPQTTAMNQTMIFDDTKARLGNKGLKLLLIEDNKTSQMVLSRFLKRVGVEVEIVDNGAEGTNLFFDRVELVAAGAGKMWDLVFVSLLSLSFVVR
jgi:CheY-like chemotaxis protein